MKKTIATMCLMSLLTITMPVQALTVKDGVDITVVPNAVTTTKDMRDYNIQATIKEDVIYKGVKIFQEGDKAILTVQDYEKEAYISRYITEKDPDLAIPIVEVKEKNGQKFSVHQEIEGKTLIGRLPEDKDNIHFESLSSPERKKLAKDIGVFLAKLHNVSLQDADSEIVKSKQMGIQAEDNPNFMEKNETLYRDLGIEYKPIKTNQEDLVLSHNDFHGGNFILDEENNFKGAIDLGEAGINYRYKDFMSLYSSYGREFIRDVVSSYNENSTTSISMEELDFHYLNKVADFAHYAARPEYAEKSPQLQKMFDKCISDYKSDKSQENVEKELAKTRQKISENKSPSRTIAKLRGISSATKAPYKPQTIAINPNTLRLYQSKKTK